MKQNRPLRALPIEGLPLHELVVEGNGKDAELSIVGVDSRRFHFAISDFSLEITTRGAVITELKALDDLTLRVRYTAEHLVLQRAQVDYPGSEEQWAKDLEAFNSGKLMSWALSRVSFEVVGSAQ